MILTNVNYDVANALVTCKLEVTIIEGVVNTIDVTLTDAELMALNPDWWLPEIKQLIELKLGEEVT